MNKVMANEYRTTVVCVDSYDNGAVSGRMYNPIIREGQKFDNLMQLLLCMDGMLDGMRFPQSFAAMREFGTAEYPVSRPESTRQEGELATFAVRIIFRQNASWQGSVTWLEGNREESFRSALELVFLMNGALSSGTSGNNKFSRDE